MKRFVSLPKFFNLSRFRFLIPLLFIFACGSVPADSDSDVVKVFILSGQSNMNGLGLKKELKNFKAAKNVFIWHKDKWCALKPLGHSRTGFSGESKYFGSEIGFGLKLAAAYPNQKIYLIKTSVNGSNLHTQWKKGSRNYKHHLTTIAKATENLKANKITFKIAGMLWMQGESDAMKKHMAKAYEDKLRELIQRIRNHYSLAELPFVVGRISSTLLNANTSYKMPYTKTVQSAQEKVAQTDKYTYVFKTDDFGLNKDNVHFNTQGQLSLGKKFAEIFIQEKLLE